MGIRIKRELNCEPYMIIHPPAMDESVIIISRRVECSLCTIDLGHVSDEIHYTVGITPLIVIP
jgi:hypothetical protein